MNSDEITVEELTERARDLARPADDTGPVGDLRLLPVRVGSEWFAIPVADVSEVLSQPLLSRVPFAPPVVAGVINLRGAIVPALDVARLLRVERAPAPFRFAVIASWGRDVIALLADEVIPIARVRSADGHAPLPTVARERARFFVASHWLGARLLTMLDMPAVLAHGLPQHSADPMARPERGPAS